MMTATLRSAQPLTPNGREREGWATVATHSHMLRSHKVDFEVAKKNLVDWALAGHVAAVGVGSPWEPVSAQHYGHYERVERDRYYAGRVPIDSVMDRESILSLFDDLNRRSAGRTLFYWDNETPKNRHGHLWYVGFEYQVPGWHDYSQDRRVQFWDGDPCEDRNALTGGCHRRRSYMEVVALQRRAGAIGIWAHPTSWWSQYGQFVTNIAAEMVTHLHADGFLDGMVVQGYDACHRAYQALWFDLLDHGACVPGFAELDACFDQLPIAQKGCFLNVLPSATRTPSIESIVRECRAARHFVSSGPHLVLTLDGQPMGAHVASGADRTHRASLTAWPAPGEQSLSRVELLGPGGKALAVVEGFTGGVLEFDVSGAACGGYVVGRAFGEHDRPTEPRQQKIRHCALTNPVYLDSATTGRLTPVTTRLTVSAAVDAAENGAPFRVLSAAGETLDAGVLRASSELRLSVPASARLELARTDGTLRDIPLAMANPRLRAHVDYLADGLFLKDSPGCASGDVPVAAFRYEAVREALQDLTLSFT